MRFGKVPEIPIPFLKPAFVKRTRANKELPKAEQCFYIGPSPNPLRDSMRERLESGGVSVSRNVTWPLVFYNKVPLRFANSFVSVNGDEDERQREEVRQTVEMIDAKSISTRSGFVDYPFIRGSSGSIKADSHHPESVSSSQKLPSTTQSTRRSGSHSSAEIKTRGASAGADAASDVEEADHESSPLFNPDVRSDETCHLC